MVEDKIALIILIASGTFAFCGIFAFMMEFCFRPSLSKIYWRILRFFAFRLEMKYNNSGMKSKKIWELEKYLTEEKTSGI